MESDIQKRLIKHLTTSIPRGESYEKIMVSDCTLIKKAN